MEITSRANPLIKKVISLADKKFRREYGEYVVEGIKPVRECIKAGLEITGIFCTRNLSAEFPNSNVLSDNLFNAVSSEKTPQGVLCTVKLPSTAAEPPKGKCLLLDRLQDPGNVGTIIRTANAAGYEEIYLIDCADAFSPKAVRASMSGLFFVKIRQGSCDEVLSALDGVPIICADMGGQDVFSFKAPKKFCLAIGNEGNGLSEIIRKKAVNTVKIPMRSSCESLNAAISAAVVMYALNSNTEV